MMGCFHTDEGAEMIRAMGEKEQELGRKVYEDALREMGFDPLPVWREEYGTFVNTVNVPDELHYRARELSYRAMGVPYEWQEVINPLADVLSFARGFLE